MVFGIGTDIVEIARLRKVLDRHPDAFMRRSFTAAERKRAEGMAHPEIYLAGRWAAKEAVAKALGVGFGKHCGWLDLEITNDEQGKPSVALSGAAADFAQAQGIQHFHISISHEQTYAVAMAIAEKGSE